MRLPIGEVGVSGRCFVWVASHILLAAFVFCDIASPYDGENGISQHEASKDGAKSW
jgi:hypothetical protein